MSNPNFVIHTSSYEISRMAYVRDGSSERPSRDGTPFTDGLVRGNQPDDTALPPAPTVLVAESRCIIPEANSSLLHYGLHRI